MEDNLPTHDDHALVGSAITMIRDFGGPDTNRYKAEELLDLWRNRWDLTQEQVNRVLSHFEKPAERW